LLSSDAFCQVGGSGNTSSNSIPLNMLPDSRRHVSPEQAQREQQIEQSYEATVNDKIPDKKGSTDPWGNVRPAPATAAAKHPRK
jgi:hypothetical protein